MVTRGGQHRGGPHMSAPSSAHCLSEMWEARESMMSSSSCWLSERRVGSLETCRRQSEGPSRMEPDSPEGQGWASESPRSATKPGRGLTPSGQRPGPLPG